MRYWKLIKIVLRLKCEMQNKNLTSLKMCFGTSLLNLSVSIDTWISSKASIAGAHSFDTVFGGLNSSNILKSKKRVYIQNWPAVRTSQLRLLDVRVKRKCFYEGSAHWHSVHWKMLTHFHWIFFSFIFPWLSSH